MKTIDLTRGKVAIVDDEDFDYLNQFNWYANRRADYSLYAVRNERVSGRRKTVRMHRIIMGDPKGLVVDHINHDTLDNRKVNLRVCTQQQNQCNRLKNRKTFSSQYKGVFLNKRENVWVSKINHEGRYIYLGRFKDERAAAMAYEAASLKYHGEFSCAGEKALAQVKQIMEEGE